MTKSRATRGSLVPPPSSAQPVEEDEKGEEETNKETGFLEDIRQLLQMNIVEEGGRVIDNLWKSLPRLTIG